MIPTTTHGVFDWKQSDLCERELIIWYFFAVVNNSTIVNNSMMASPLNIIPCILNKQNP